MDAFLNYWGAAHSRERQWRFNVNDGDGDCDGDGKDLSTEQANSNSVAKQQYVDVNVKQNASLPVLLHLREIGFSWVEKKFGRRASSATWKSRLLHQPISASIVPPTIHSSSASQSQSQWNALQFSTPTYYGKYSNINSDSEYATISCTGMGAMDNADAAEMNDAIHLHRHSWRPYTQHKIPFSKLRTSISDA